MNTFKLNTLVFKAYHKTDLYNTFVVQKLVTIWKRENIQNNTKVRVVCVEVTCI